MSHSTMLSRRQQREIVMKSLYMKEIRNGDVSLDELILTSLPPFSHNKLNQNNDSLEYVTGFLRTSIEHQEHIIAIIDNALMKNNKSLDDLSLLDKSILCMAIAEMNYYDTDHSVIINEAIEISKQYSSEHSFKIINGVLDAYHKSLTEKT